MCELYIAHGLCNDFPDWSIAAVGLEDSVKIGYEYVQNVTGEEHHGGQCEDRLRICVEPLLVRNITEDSVKIGYEYVWNRYW